MKILFLGDIVGPSGCKVVKNYLPDIIKQKNLDFVVANGENAVSNFTFINSYNFDFLIHNKRNKNSCKINQLNYIYSNFKF